MAPAVRWVCLCLLLVALPGMAEGWRTLLPGAQRLGVGDFTWFGLRLYTARLWAVEPIQGWNQPFALELTYHRSLSRDTLVQASLEEMRRLGGGNVTTQQLDIWAQWLREAFVEVSPGMRITGLYLPEQGSRFYVDGRPTQAIPDPAFARAFFAIWLDARARDPQLRQRLLGLAGNPQGD